MRKLLKDKRGDMLPLLMVIMVVIFTFSMIIGEVFRLHGIHSHVEYELQRAVNIAVEEAMADSWRQDKLNHLDEAQARNDFYTYLASDLGLTGAYQMVSGEGDTIYKLQFELVATTVDPPVMRVKGIALVPPAFPFLPSDIEMPFDIRSKNFRIDE